MPDREDGDGHERQARTGERVGDSGAERGPDHLKDAAGLAEPRLRPDAEKTDEVVQETEIRVEHPLEDGRGRHDRRDVWHEVHDPIGAASAGSLVEHECDDERGRHFDRHRQEDVPDRDSEGIDELAEASARRIEDRRVVLEPRPALVDHSPPRQAHHKRGDAWDHLEEADQDQRRCEEEVGLEMLENDPVASGGDTDLRGDHLGRHRLR